MINIRDLTITQAQELLRSGECTAVELTQSALSVIEKENPEINAYLEVFDDALENAKAADDMLKNGTGAPLTGIPMATKDNILLEGKVASAASKILENYHATYDSTVAKKLRAAGAVFLGRTNMDEFAMGASTEQSAYGPTKNPLDKTRVPGGSSGGSAAAVAMGSCLATLGSDTAGSIRQPSAFCGVVGLKPTYGSVSRHGLIALGSSLDVIGSIAKTVSDVEIVFNTIKGKDVYDSTTVDATDYPNTDSGNGKKIGVPGKFLENSGIREDVYQNFQTALEVLQTLGYTIVDIELPHVSYSVPTYYILLPAEASTNLARFDGVKYGLHVDGKDLTEDYLRSRGKGFGPEPRRRIMIGTYVLSSGYYDAYYNKANAVRRHIMNDFKEAFREVDVIATPTTANPAFKIGAKIDDPIQLYLEDVFTVPANHTGIPALTVPSGVVLEEGVNLPLGLQLLAPHMCEERLFAIGKKFLGEL